MLYTFTCGDHVEIWNSQQPSQRVGQAGITTQAWPACTNGYSAFLIRNANVRGDEMDEFAYVDI